MNSNAHRKICTEAGLSELCQLRCPIVAEFVAGDLEMALEDVAEARQSISNAEAVAELDELEQEALNTASTRAEWLAARCPEGGPIKKGGAFICAATMGDEPPGEFFGDDIDSDPTPDPGRRSGRRGIIDIDTKGLL